MQLSNLSCGDAITVYLTIENGVISDAAFQAEGCAIAIASASILSETLQGKSVSELEAMDITELTALLGIELTPSRQKCAILGLQAFQKAATG